MPDPLPRSYAPLIGKTVSDARVDEREGCERLILVYGDGSRFEVSAAADNKIEVVEVAAAGQSHAGADPQTPAPGAFQRDVAVFARDLWRTFSDASATK